MATLTHYGHGHDAPTAPKPVAGSIVLGYVESDSDSTRRYTIKRGKDGVIYCSCPAWKYSRGTKSCKHLRGIASGTRKMQTA